MMVYISDDPRVAPQLRSVDDLAALSVHVAGGLGDPEVLSRALADAGAGSVDGDHAWLHVAWLRAAAGDRDAAWHEGFTAMLDYASVRGWVSADGRHVRAHVIWSTDGR